LRVREQLFLEGQPIQWVIIKGILVNIMSNIFRGALGEIQGPRHRARLFIYRKHAREGSGHQPMIGGRRCAWPRQKTSKRTL
jgi:hypothetical protein